MLHSLLFPLVLPLLTPLAFASPVDERWGNVVRINEFVAANSSGFADDDSEYADWIELYNSGAEPLDLAGYALTDDLDDAAKWTFPSVTIDAHGYLVVWASGKDRISPTAVHANFKLSKDGEQIGLFGLAGQALDTLTFAQQFTDLACGRYPDGGDNWHFLTPTPGAANAPAIAPPQVSVAQGFYPAAVTVDVTCTTADAVIRYSLDGSAVTRNSPLWSTLRIISQNTILRAASFRGVEKSPVITKTYLIDQLASIPSLSLVIDPADLYDATSGIYTHWQESGDAWERPGHLTCFQSDGAVGFSLDGGFRIHGSSSRAFPKKSFRIYFRPEYGSGSLRYDLFPECDIEKFDRLVLHNGSSDELFYPGRWTVVKNALVAETARSTPVLAAHGRFVAVYLNGENWGIYYLRERVDEHFFIAHFGTDQFDVLKGNTSDELSVELGSDSHWKSTHQFFETSYFANAAHYQRAAQLVDLDCFIDYQIIGSFIGDHDWPHNNFYVLRRLSGDTRWRWMFWDSDHAFANYVQEDVFLNSIQWITRNSVRPDLKLFGSADDEKYLWATLMLRKLLGNSEFKQKFVIRYADLLNTTLSEKKLVSRIDSLQTLLSGTVYKEYDKWGSLAHAETSLSWEQNMAFLRDYVQRRQEIIREYLAEKFGLGARHTLILTTSGGGRVKVNTIYADSSHWTGRYFAAYPVHLKAEAKPGSEFLGWSDPSLPDVDSVDVTLSSDYAVTAFFSDEVFRQRLDFDEGWNTFSLAISPQNGNDLLDILAPIQANLIKVLDEDGQSIERLFGVWHNYIGEWRATEGYDLKADSAVSLELAGYEIATPADIDLKRGWNIISYVCREEAQDAMLLFRDLIADEQLIKVIDRKGQTLEKIFGVWYNYIGNVKPTEGLKVKVRQSCTLTQACQDAPLAKELLVQKPQHLRLEGNGHPFQPMQFYFYSVRINGQDPEPGDEIAVYDGDRLVGATIVQPPADRPTLVIAGKSDGVSQGFIEGHPFSLKIWKKRANQLLDIDAEAVSTWTPEGLEDGSLRSFQGLASVIIKIELTATVFRNCSTSAVLYQNYPNPFNFATTLPFVVSEKSDVRIEIFDIRGVSVRLLTAGIKEAGRYTIRWDGEDDRGVTVGAGLYICRFISGDVVQNRKLLCIK
ncbi:CotH kinase family protein [candidate division KSB1 bacterium]|nr:CotH kinase family protein [candidate division KSB1 bacterium]RQW08547.1 MAG: T9SS C-terminal target domain-containing protein [candidate division KSB1 bacterium]